MSIVDVIKQAGSGSINQIRPGGAAAIPSAAQGFTGIAGAAAIPSAAQGFTGIAGAAAGGISTAANVASNISSSVSSSVSSATDAAMNANTAASSLGQTLSATAGSSVPASSGKSSAASSSTNTNSNETSGPDTGSWGSGKDASIWALDGSGEIPNTQTLPFMFEVQVDGEVEWQMVLPFNPEGYRMVYSPRANTTLTQSGIFEDNIGLAPPKFYLKGVFGYVGTTLLGMAKSLDSEAKSGVQLYQELEAGMMSFYERFGLKKLDGTDGTELTPDTTPELFFYNFSDQEYWQVQVTQFTLERNTQHRHLYQYDIQLSALKRVADTEGPDPIMDELAAAEKSRFAAEKAKAADASVSLWESFMNSAKGVVKTVQGTVAMATSAFQSAQKEMTNLKGMMTQISTAVQGFSSGLKQTVDLPFSVILTAKSSLDSIMKSVAEIGGLPDEFTNDMRQIQKLINGYSRYPELFTASTTTITGATIATTGTGTTGTSVTGTTTTGKTPVTSTSTSTSTTSTTSTSTTTTPSTTRTTTTTTTTTTTKPAQLEIVSVPVTTDTTKKTGATGMGIPEETIFSPGIESTKPVSSSEGVVKEGDTIFTIAQKTDSDWKQIVALNDLEYPYIANTPLDLFSPVKQTTIAPYIPAGSIKFIAAHLTPQPNEILTFANGTVVAEVLSVKGAEITIKYPPMAIQSYTEVKDNGSAQTLAPYSPVEVIQGDTIRLHERVLDVLLTGDTLLIPGRKPATSMVMSDSGDFYEMLYGTDEALDANGNMMVSNTGDIGTSTKLTNLEQQLQHRILTSRGELAEIGHPEYGSLVPVFIGKPMTAVWMMRILLECKIAIASDPRIKRTANAKFYHSGSSVYFTADVYPASSSNPVSVSIPIA